MSQDEVPTSELADDLHDDWDQPPNDGLIAARRQRRRWLTSASATLAAILIGLIGFYAGIREERSQVAVSSSAVLTASSASSTSGTRPTTSAPSARTGSAAKTASGSPPSFGSGGFAGAAGGTAGTVASVDGDTIYVKETSGDTVAVKLLATTTITKSITVKHTSVHPGDAVTIQGANGSGGKITATSVTDSGDSTTSTSSAG